MSARPVLRLEGRVREDATASLTVVSVSGVWTAREPVELGSVELEVELTDGVRRFPALPDEAAVATPLGTTWRAAFKLPRDVADGARAFTLLVGGAAPVQLRDELFEALDRARAAEQRAAGAEGRLAAVERERRRLEGTPAADRGPAGDATERPDPRVDDRIQALEQQLDAARRRTDELSEALAAAHGQVERAVERLQVEAEARDRAEAGASPGSHRRGPQDRDEETDAPGGTRDPEGSRAHVGDLEADAMSARAEADDLAGRLLATHRQLEEAVARLRDETEARMRAESRAQSAPGSEDAT